MVAPSGRNVPERCNSFSMLEFSGMSDAGTANQKVAFRRQMETLLASKSFSSSRQLSDFLRYISERAFEGATELGQEEIAEHVLGNSREFVAAYDSSVRKFASLTRQRLARYYEQEGRGDEVVVTLPLRSYLPTYRFRSDAPPDQQLEPARPKRMWLLLGLPVIGLCAFAAYFAWTHSTSTALLASRSYLIQTARGDLLSGADVPGKNVLIGEPLEDGESLTARLEFTPEFEAQQAGILVWQDENHSVRLGRGFLGRNQIEFGTERQGSNSTPAENVVFDPDGQNGKPLWLSIHRTGERYTGWISRDGVDWRTVGVPVEFAGMRSPRTGIYAYHGRRDAPSARAVFSHVSRGYIFAASAQTDWHQRIVSSCSSETLLTEAPTLLLIRLLSDASGCSSILRVGQLGDRDWTVEARIDSASIPGAMAGIFVRGKQGRLRVIRYGADNPVIALMHDSRGVYQVPDYHGSPPLSLRLERKGSWIIGAYSRDGDNFRPFEHKIPAGALGADLGAGLILATSIKGKSPFPPALSAYFIRRELHNLAPYR